MHSADYCLVSMRTGTSLKILKKAIHEAEKALHTYKETLLLEGQKY